MEYKELKVGEPAPDFEIRIGEAKTESQQKTAFHLKEQIGKNVVLYFYPKDNTPGCSIQAKSLSDSLAEIEALGGRVLGISADDLAAHESFKKKFCLKFELGADTDKEVCQLYGVWKEKSMFGRKYMGIERSTFIIDKEGVLRHIWRNVSVVSHADKVIKALKELQ